MLQVALISGLIEGSCILISISDSVCCFGSSIWKKKIWPCAANVVGKGKSILKALWITADIFLRYSTNIQPSFSKMSYKETSEAMSTLSKSEFSHICYINILGLLHWEDLFLGHDFDLSDSLKDLRHPRVPQTVLWNHLPNKPLTFCIYHFSNIPRILFLFQ